MSAARSPRGSRAPDDQDLFVRTVWAVLDTVQNNSRAVIVGFIATALFLGGILWFRSYQQNLQETAASEIQTLRAELATGRDTAARRSLESFVERYAGTPAAREARLLLARVQLRDGEPAAALETLRSIEESLDRPTGYAAALLRAAAHESAGRTDRAIEIYGRVAEEARFAFQRHEAADRQAALLVEQGRLEEAERIYGRLVQETSTGSAGGSAYAVRLGEVRAMLRSRSGARPGGPPTGSAESAAAVDST